MSVPSRQSQSSCVKALIFTAQGDLKYYIFLARTLKDEMYISRDPEGPLWSRKDPLTHKMIPSKRISIYLCLCLPSGFRAQPCPAPKLENVTRTGIDPASEGCFASPFSPISTSSNALLCTET